MKHIYYKTLLVSLAAALVFVSCDKASNETLQPKANQAELDVLAEQLLFIGDAISTKMQLQSQSTFNELQVKFDLGRRKKQCRGFGICRLVKSPVPFMEVIRDDDTILENDNDFQKSNIHYDALNGDFYFLVLLGENLPADVDVHDATFVVDEDIVLTTADINFSLAPATLYYQNLARKSTLIVLAGNYVYDKTLGSYGGYKIIFE